jgi:hypothetical protein
VAPVLPRVFLHASRSNGTISSICRRCLVTIASKLNEVDLLKPEGAHICSDFSLRGMLYPEQVAEPDKRIAPQALTISF